MKKLSFPALLSAMMLFISHISHITINAEENNLCGDSITWNYDEKTKTLGLYGVGDMYDYEDYLGYKAPWAYYEIEHVSVSNGITSIGAYAFYSCTQLEILDIPESVSKIGEAAFMGTGIQSINLQIEELGNYAFKDCHSLHSVVLQSGVKAIGDGCFSGDYLLSSLTIPETVNHIGADAFNGCAAWYQAQTEDFVILGDGILCKYLGSDTEITVPDSVKQICANTFISPIYLFLPDGETVSLDKPNTAITKIIIPDTVSAIANSTFRDLAGLQAVELPAHLKEIGNEAFYGCTSLNTIDIPKTVQHIGKNAFYSNPWLSDAGDYVILGDGLLYIFQGRQKIINVPEQVKTVLTEAFSGDKILEIRFSDSVKKIEPKSVSCKNAVIISEPNGIAAQYAAAEEIPFRSAYEVFTPQGEKMQLDYCTDGWYFGNSQSVFGDDYYLTDIDREHLTDLGINTHSDNPWSGSCVGLAITVILAKNSVFSPAQLQTGAKSLSDIEPTDDAISFINYFQCIQGQDGTSSAYEPGYLKFYRMLNIAKNIPYGESPFLLTFATASGSHGVVGYGQETGSWTFDGKTYNGRILVWDSNFPKALHEESCLYYDSETFDYCIPYYGVHVADGAENNTAGIITVCNDIDVLNAYPYPFDLHVPAGDINCDGSVNVADVVLLLKHLTAQTELTDSQLRLADISGDLKVNAVDLTLLKRNLMKN